MHLPARSLGKGFLVVGGRVDVTCNAPLQLNVDLLRRTEKHALSDVRARGGLHRKLEPARHPPLRSFRRPAFEEGARRDVVPEQTLGHQVQAFQLWRPLEQDAGQLVHRIQVGRSGQASVFHGRENVIAEEDPAAGTNAAGVPHVAQVGVCKVYGMAVSSLRPPANKNIKVSRRAYR